MEELLRTSETIGSDRVEGTLVFDRSGDKIGHVEKLLIRKISGQVTDAVLSVGGFLGIGGELHSIPWEKLDYDPELGGYKLDVEEEELREAPRFVDRDEARLYDPEYQESVYRYWAVTPYWY